MKKKNTGLKLNIQKTNIMEFGPITSWQINEERMEKVTDFTFLGSKTTTDGDMQCHLHVTLQMAAMNLKDTCPLEEKL